MQRLAWQLWGFRHGLAALNGVLAAMPILTHHGRLTAIQDPQDFTMPIVLNSIQH